MSALSILQHACGLDEYGCGTFYRDHFCAGPGHSDYETCCQLVADGLMSRRDGLPVVGGTMFWVTVAGKDWVRANSPPPPKLTRAQKRYRQWLDADCEMTFGEYILAGRG